MNYITHLNAVFQVFYNDNRLNTTHISLYMALFQLWNISRFADLLYINRHEVMQFSKIGSISTYHRLLRDLVKWNYIEYYPSHNIYKGSQVRMPIFGTTSGQVSNNNRTTSGTTSEHLSVHNTNNKKQIENIKKLDIPKDEIIVIGFFKKKKWPLKEALKFYNHYQAIGWKLGGKIKIVDWHAKAESWMLNAEDLKSDAEFVPKDNLKTTKHKDYGQPL